MSAGIFSYNAAIATLTEAENKLAAQQNTSLFKQVRSLRRDIERAADARLRLRSAVFNDPEFKQLVAMLNRVVPTERTTKDGVFNALVLLGEGALTKEDRHAIRSCR